MILSLWRALRVCENILFSAGLKQVRCRYHTNVLRIEIDGAKISEAVVIIQKQLEKLKAVGFKYITVDIEGYKKGSMNQ